MITVVNRKFYKGHGIYIGRPMPKLGLEGSPLANEFRIGKGMTREQSMAAYTPWFWEQMFIDGSAVRAEIARLTEMARYQDLTLICWCKPEACHGDIVKMAIEWMLQ